MSQFEEFEKEKRSRDPKKARLKEFSIEYLLQDIGAYWKMIVVFATPLVLLALPTAARDPKANCAYIMLIMAIYWLTEVVPLPVTAFLPIIFFPVLNVASASTIAASYMQDTNVVLLGGLLMALAIEEVDLHKRVALRVLIWMGSEPRWLMFGVITTTAFCSMWMSNTSAAALMLPIALIVLDEVISFEMELSEQGIEERANKTALPDIEKAEVGGGLGNLEDNQKPATLSPQRKRENKMRSPAALLKAADRTKAQVVSSTKSERRFDFDRIPSNLQGMCKAMLLCVAFGANLGGTATLNGTTSSLMFTSLITQHYRTEEEESLGINYANWLGFGLPFMMVTVCFTWAWLVLYFMGWQELFGCRCRRGEAAAVDSLRDRKDIRAVFRRHYKMLGKIKFAEWVVIFWFSVIIVLWVTRDPNFVKGWASLFPSRYVTDAGPAVLIPCILFVFPKEAPDWIFFRKDKSASPKLRDSILTWSNVQKRAPWGIVLLMGGGLAMAEGSKQSKLSDKIGCVLKDALDTTTKPVILLLVVSIVTVVTQVSSNSVTLAIVMPVILNLADELYYNPLYFALPATMASSFAMMLPVGTPPNAIVYGTNMIGLKDMIISGSVVIIVCMCVLIIDISSWGFLLFNLGESPSWQTHGNGSIVGCS